MCRRRALRRLWRSNPTFAVLDGLNEYDDDYTKGFVPPGTLKTAYQAGRGFVSRTLEDAGESEEAATPEPDGAAKPPEENAQEPEAEQLSEAPAEDKRPGEAEAGQDEADKPVSATRRRMAFRRAGTGGSSRGEL